MFKRNIFVLALLLFSVVANSQELQAKVMVVTQQIASSENKNKFVTLQNQLTDLLNNRKWTSDVFQPQERIACNFLLNLSQVVDDNTYKATLTVQAARPVYNSGYQSPIANYQDGDVTFKYVEFQPVEFNENRVSGTDPLAGNLTAVFAYYVYMILGLDYDSFAPKGGTAYFQKAQNIVNNAPESRNISGWKAFDGSRNRYWLANNVTNTKLNPIHDIFYDYFRNGLDQMYSNQVAARESVLGALSRLKDFNQENPNTMIMAFFLQNRSDEIIGIFKKADPPTKAKAVEILSKIDVGNISKYRNELR